MKPKSRLRQRALSNLAATLLCSTWAMAASAADPSVAVRSETRCCSGATVAALGFSPTRLARLDEFLQDEIQKDELAGIVTIVSRRGQIIHYSALGYANAAKKIPMRKDSIFRIHSMTKPVVATAMMILYEEGRLKLDDPVSKYIPEFKNIRALRGPDSLPSDTVPLKREISLHDLLRFTSGAGEDMDGYSKAGVFDANITLEESARRIATIPLRYQPGERWTYSLDQKLIERIVEVVSGQSFDQFLKDRLFSPLGMQDTAFWVNANNTSRLVAIHWSKDGKVVPMDSIHGYPKLYEALRIDKSLAPHANMDSLVGTAEDYWRFAQMIEDGGVFGGRRILGPATVNYMTRNQLNPSSLAAIDNRPGMGWGLGLAVVQNDAMAGTLIPTGSSYWVGGGNTLFWIDPQNEIVVVAMAQNLDPDGKMITAWALRQQISAIVYGALEKSERGQDALP